MYIILYYVTLWPTEGQLLLVAEMQLPLGLSLLKLQQEMKDNVAN